MKNLRVFVLEEDELVSEMLFKVFAHKGISQIDLAKSEEEAERFIQNKYDFLLLDTLTGDGRAYGPRVLEMFERSLNFPELVIATGISVYRENWRGRRIRYFLEKPYGLGELFSKIKEHLPIKA